MITTSTHKGTNKIPLKKYLQLFAEKVDTEKKSVCLNMVVSRLTNIMVLPNYKNYKVIKGENLQ